MPGDGGRGGHGHLRVRCGALLGLIGAALLAVPGAVLAAQAVPRSDEHILRDREVDTLTRLATARLAAPNPSRSDFEAAARSFDIIRTLDPADIDLLRRSIEAWTAAGDGEAEIVRTRELLTLDPADTYAQLRVTLAGLGRLQNADDRLTAYSKLLGERGDAIDPSVRSRLALDAALLARDNGDDALSLKYLTLATTLDPTNKEAAALFAGNLLQITGDPFDRVDILCNVILADPLDPSAYENLALELLQYGAFSGALRAFRISADINNHLGRQLNEDRIFDFALCEWNVLGPEVAINRLAVVLRDTILAEEARRQAIIDDGLDPGEKLPMLLPPRLQLLRLAIAASDKQTDALKKILEDYSIGNDQVIAAYQARLAQIHAQDEPDAIVTRFRIHPIQRMIATIIQPRSYQELRETNTQIQVYKLQRLWAQLAAGDQLDEAEAYITELEEARRLADLTGADPTLAPPIAAEVLQRYRGWLLVMQHEDAEAEKLLTPLVEKDHLARWAMGLLKEQQGLTKEAATHYAILARDQPTTAVGSTAFFRLKLILDKPIIRSSIAAELDERIASFAPWLESITRDPSRFMSARVTVDPQDATIFDRPVIRVTIRNIARWPLGVGTQRPIPKRMLLAPRVRADGRDVSQAVGPMVGAISSRLRLEPAAEVVVEIHPLREHMGRLLDNGAAERFDARWQLIQNFVSSENGFKASPLTITAQSDILTRAALDARTETSQLIEQIKTGEGLTVISDILIAGDLILAYSTPKAQENPEQVEARMALASAIVARIPELPEVERTIAITRCAELSMFADDTLSAALNEVLANETATLPLLAAVLGLAWTPDAPVLDLAEKSGNADVARVATLVREGLQLAIDHPESHPESPPTDGPGDGSGVSN